MRLFARLALIALAAPAILAAQTTPPADPLHAWLPSADPAAVESWVNAHLAAERAAVAQVVAAQDPRTVANTVAPFDEAQNQLAIAGSEAGLLFQVGNTAALRDKAQQLAQAVSTAGTELSLNPDVYKALAAVDSKSADPATRHYLDRTLLEYRLSGVDKDEATRKQIRALQDKITALSLTFGRNVQDGLKKISATKAELDGLPDDYIARHPANPDGSYTLTTDYPDMSPVLAFAHNAELRKRMGLAYTTRAYPQNKQVLLDLLAARQDLAAALGFPNYAAMATADQMIGSPEKLKVFLDAVDAASRESGDREWTQLLTFAQKRQPDAVITTSDREYWSELYRRAEYSFDSQSVRPYFPYEAVQAGILKTAARLFHLEFKADPAAQTWDPSVSVFDVYDAALGATGKKLGRIYLDMHPRDGKDKWFSSAPVIPGIRGKQLPEGALICNFPGGKAPGSDAKDPGLMEYDDVVTFFHEFGHLMHHILGGQNEWSAQGGFNVEGDFVEAPSQMLEEFFRDPTILQSFGKHYQTGEVLPLKLIDQMNRAGAYGRAGWLQRQLLYSTYSLQLHNRPPAQVDLDALWTEDSKRFSHTELVPGTEFWASFTHLTGYASNYYTYVLDKVIAIDFFAQFDKKNLLDGPTAMRYRRKVLERGATVPAQQLVDDFLGRPENMEAIKSWLNVQFTQSAAN